MSLQDASRLSPCISAACIAGSRRCSRSDHTSASLNALYSSLSRTSAHTHSAGLALYSTLCTRHCRDERGAAAGLEDAAKRGAFVAEVCASGFILARFTAFLLSSDCGYASVCACVCVDVKSLNGISEGLSGGR